MLQLLQMCPRNSPVAWSWSTTSFASFPQRWHGDPTGGGGYIFSESAGLSHALLVAFFAPAVEAVLLLLD